MRENYRYCRFEDRNGKLVDLANSLIERKELMSGAQLSVKKMCEEWKGADCVQVCRHEI